MKKILLLGIILLNVLFLSAQHLRIEKEKTQLYITHKVAVKETLYSLGRMYLVSPKEIALANKLKADAGLQVGQYIKIPLKKTNFVQSTLKNKKQGQPVYHTVKKGDNLYKLSKKYNNVKESELKKWNHLSKNTVKAGQEIIVGYLKINDKEESKDEVAATRSKPKVDSSKAVAKTQKAELTAASKTELVTAETVPQVQQVSSIGQQQNEITTASQTSVDESYFAANYSINAANALEKKINGTAATFKSTSGWSDKKYYILMNEVAPETIVKVMVNGKFIYAKVLESLPDLKDNKAIVCRLSNAAASALGITEAKFEVEIAFYE